MNLDLLITSIKKIIKMEIIFSLVKAIINSPNLNEDQFKWKKK